MDSKEEVCAICIGAMNAGQGQALFTAECSHTFHFTCIASNVQHGNHICPTCRATWRNLPSQLNPTPNHTYVGTVDATTFADDDPLPVPSSETLDPTSNTTPLSPQNTGMTVNALPEYPALSKSDQSNPFAVLISMKASPLSPEEATDRPNNDRTPLDLIAVLDVSDSMDGNKIRLLKQAVGFVADNLGPSDRLSIVTFASFARRVTPLRRMNDAGRSDTIRAVNSLRVSGSTDIMGGLKKAVEVLQQRREKNPVSSIILLSDGQDNKCGFGYEFLQSLHDLPLCLRANDIPINAPQTTAVPVHSFGFGSDHDATALHAIADRSGGTFSYIESLEIIQDAFAQCIGGLMSVVAQQVEMQAKSVSPEVQIQSIVSGRYRNSIDADKLHGLINIGDMYAEEEKKFLVYLSVPPADVETLTTQLLEVKCSYKDPLSSQIMVSDIVSVEIRRPIAEELSEQDRQVNLAVDRERNRISITEGIMQAQELAGRGELEAAQSLLQQRRETIMQSFSAQEEDASSDRLLYEVSEIQERMSSMAEYESGGRAYAYSMMNAHLYQRASTQAAEPESDDDISFSLFDDGPTESTNYQTPFMKKMVLKSRVSRQSGNHDESSNP